MEIIDETKEENKTKKNTEKFLDYLNKHWKEGRTIFKIDDDIGEISFWKRGFCIVKFGEASIDEDNNIEMKMKSKYIRRKKYDFNEFKNLLKTYEQKGKAKISLTIQK